MSRSRGCAAAFAGAVVVAASLAAPAGAVRISAKDVAKSCVARAHVPVPPHVLRIAPGAADAYTLVDRRRPTIVIGELALARWKCHVVLHELGHAFDLTRLTPALRRELKTSILRSPRPWFGLGRDSPAEQFAELFYFCATRKAFRSAIRLGALVLEAKAAASACLLVRRSRGPART